jgi:hypothetical protein
LTASVSGRANLLRARFGLTEPAHGFAQAHRKRRDGFYPLETAFRKLGGPLPARFGEQELRVAENAGKRMVEFVAQDFSEGVGNGGVRRRGE